MANNLGDYAKDKVLDHLFRVAAYTMPSALGVALSTDNPTGDGSGLSEPSASDSYARVAVTSGIFTTAAASGHIANAAVITFPTATGAGWGEVVYVAILDDTAIGAGNLLWHGPLSVAKTVVDGETVSFPVGSLVASLQ